MPRLFSVPCPHHGQHTWQLAELTGGAAERVQNCAREVARGYCPDPCAVLTFEDISPELSSPTNWTLRRARHWADDGETIVAMAHG